MTNKSVIRVADVMERDYVIVDGVATVAEALAILREAAACLAGTGAEHVKPGGGGADISPMAADGVIQVGYRSDSQRYFDVHHSALDTLDAVNERELHLGAAAIAFLAWVVADRPERLPR